MQKMQVVASSPAKVGHHRRRRRQKQRQKLEATDDELLVPRFVSDSVSNVSSDNKNTLGTTSPHPERLHKLSDKLVTIHGKQLQLFFHENFPFSEVHGLSSSNKVLSETTEKNPHDRGKTEKGPSISKCTTSSSSSSSNSSSSINQDLFLFDSETCERIYPNECLHRIDNGDISGYMLAMISTNDYNVPHFTGRKRKIELQFQIQFKKVPKHPLYIGCELKGSTRISAWQKTLLKTMAASIERRNKHFLYNLETSEELRYEDNYDVDDDGSCDFQPSRGPYMALPFESSVNALVVTKKGDIPPILGEALKQDEHESSKNGTVEINTSDTYSFALWTANFDLPQWRCTSRSTIQPFSLNTLIGGQPFSLSLYSMNPSNHKIKRYFELEISHRLSQVGPARKAWLMQKNVLHSSTTDSLLDMVSENELISGPKVYYPEDRNDMDSSCQRSCVCWSDWE